MQPMKLQPFCSALQPYSTGQSNYQEEQKSRKKAKLFPSPYSKIGWLSLSFNGVRQG